jgi:hypothetical protein
MEYDQRVIIKFLWNEGADARDIGDKLQVQFGEHVYQLRTIRFWIAETRLGRQDLHDEIRTGRPLLDDLDATILAIFGKCLFKSAYSIIERLLVAHSTVLLHFHNFIGFKLFHLYWIPHLLTNDLREKRKENARTMLLLLHAVERDGWHHLVTGNES